MCKAWGGVSCSEKGMSLSRGIAARGLATKAVFRKIEKATNRGLSLT